MEQVRMAPLGTGSYIVGKTLPYFVIAVCSSTAIILASMVLFGLPMNGSSAWLAMSAKCPLADIWTCNAWETECQTRSNTPGKSP